MRVAGANSAAERARISPSRLRRPASRLDLLEDVGDVHVAADHAGELLEEGDQAPPSAAARQRAVDRGGHLHHVEGLLEVVADAVADRVGRGVERTVAGDDDDLDVREVEADRAHQLLAAKTGHREVERHDVDRRGVEDLERFGAARDHRHVVGGRQDHAERLAGAAFVIDDRARGRGRELRSITRVSSVRLAIARALVSQARCQVPCGRMNRFKSSERKGETSKKRARDGASKSFRSERDGPVSETSRSSS